MAEEYSHRFRTAVGGFHKGDVSAYIAKISGLHRAELSELQQALTSAQQENEILREQLAAMQTEPETPSYTSTADSETAEAELCACAPETLKELELEAYRRAEKAERLAYQRAGRLYEDMQDIYDASGTQLRNISGAAAQAMDAVETALQTLKDALEHTQDTAKQSAETLDAMGATIPDPAEELENAT